jgi:hypothetical protein
MSGGGQRGGCPTHGAENSSHGGADVRFAADPRLTAQLQPDEFVPPGAPASRTLSVPVVPPVALVLSPVFTPPEPPVPPVPAHRGAQTISGKTSPV